MYTNILCVFTFAHEPFLGDDTQTSSTSRPTGKCFLSRIRSFTNWNTFVSLIVCGGVRMPHPGLGSPDTVPGSKEQTTREFF